MRALLLRGLFFASILLFAYGSARAEVVRDIFFPVQGEFTMLDNFGDPRSGGRTHEGTDILGKKMTPLLSAVDGRVVFMPFDEPSWGYAVYIRDSDGYEYSYLHINNDTPGTNDGLGGPENAYAPGLERGSAVTRGQFIGWMGDSGNAEGVGSHLHFEIWTPENIPIDPQGSLIAALEKSRYNPVKEMEMTTNINTNRSLGENPPQNPPCVSDTLITSQITQAVYYCGSDGKRYVFPNEKTYFTWYDDFSEVVQITPEELALVPIGGNARYRPGVRLVKIQTDPKVYAVSRGGMLRWVTSPEAAEKLYGTNWPDKIDDISDVFFVNYVIGDPIYSSEY